MSKTPAKKAPAKKPAGPAAGAGKSAPKAAATAPSKPAAKAAATAASKKAAAAPVKPAAKPAAKPAVAAKPAAKPAAAAKPVEAKVPVAPKTPEVKPPPPALVKSAVSAPPPPAPAPSTPRPGSKAAARAAAEPLPAPMPPAAARFADRVALSRPGLVQRAPEFEASVVAGKADPKLANAWKHKSGRDLTEPELMAMPESEYMSDKQLEFFRTRLQRLKDDLLSNADETTEHLREDTSIVPDPADRATIEEEHALELRTRDRERKLLKKISQSLARIDSGEYGFCDETGEPIGLARLIARPTATLSLEAQQRRELKQKMFGD